ncbi:glycosyl hydrolase family 3 [Alicyclobacillus tengchongensis]|nr:glycosyl hydrolase family 3 [Alicyclobacillus tengchongensis]
MKHKDLIARMTLEEKASLLSGKDFWHMQNIANHDIPSLTLTDGPHGVRMQEEGETQFKGKPATCFPTASALASSWDAQLLEQVGQALGQECRSLGVHVLLGPGANLKRSPLCGRNFEYFSEDPVLSGELAAAHIRGVQSQGVGASLKHFAANNQEHRRMTVSAEVDERTLREMYLASFERAVKQGQPWTVMCAYNRINGTYCSEHKWLLTDVLRTEWRFDGIVVSDWGAVNNRVSGVEAGLDLEMPGGPGTQDDEIVRAVREGRLDEALLDKAVDRLLTLVERAYQAEPAAPFDTRAHHTLARKVASECMVLLKNEGNILPIQEGTQVAIIGAFAKEPRYQGGGSSHVTPTRLDVPYDECAKLLGNHVCYADGYRLDTDEADDKLIADAVQLAKTSDVAIVFAGLPERYESEGYDRQHLSLPPAHNRLIAAIAAAQPKTVVVLTNGAPVEMPWVNQVPAIIEAYLAGQAFGGAIADVLTGRVNPSGKLAETFPVKLEHTPAHPFFPGEGDISEYREGIFVGYRYYDAKAIEPLFPFGHGLSYTSFAYTDVEVSGERIRDDEPLEVRIRVTNTGPRPGKEVVQLYVGDDVASVIRPRKELKAFAKVELQPGEEKTVTLVLDKRAFAFWDLQCSQWRVESGTFTLSIGSSSRDIRLTKQVQVESTTPRPPVHVHANATIGDLLTDPQTGPVLRGILQEAMLSSPLGGMAEHDPELFEAFIRYTPLSRTATLGGIPRQSIQQVIERLRQAQEG